ncbi:GATA zinc finger domain-containing protein 14-like [Teleopsis dalmanni]|uniref:GATA zinc finger domain-containing protein 14-like n=1 Tax=Teleopsis dalmanni TaxID=139649 RepID=UPI0018CFD22E|nr:GATA zinc finger domain-containing protein 14-like [Teleopsis dalmanni]
MIKIKNSKGKLKNKSNANVRPQQVLKQVPKQVPPVIMPNSQIVESCGTSLGDTSASVEPSNYLSGPFRFGDFPVTLTEDNLNDQDVFSASVDNVNLSDSTNARAQNSITDKDCGPLILINSNINLNLGLKSNILSHRNFARNSSVSNVPRTDMVDLNRSSNETFTQNAADTHVPMEEISFGSFSPRQLIPQYQYLREPNHNRNSNESGTNFFNSENVTSKDSYVSNLSTPMPQNIVDNENQLYSTPTSRKIQLNANRKLDFPKTPNNHKNYLQNQNKYINSNPYVSKNSGPKSPKKDGYDMSQQSYAPGSSNADGEYLHSANTQRSPKSFKHFTTGQNHSPPYYVMNNQDMSMQRNTLEENFPNNQIRSRVFSKSRKMQQNYNFDRNRFSYSSNRRHSNPAVWQIPKYYTPNQNRFVDMPSAHCATEKMNFGHFYEPGEVSRYDVSKHHHFNNHRNAEFNHSACNSFTPQQYFHQNRYRKTPSPHYAVHLYAADHPNEYRHTSDEQNHISGVPPNVMSQQSDFDNIPSSSNTVLQNLMNEQLQYKNYAMPESLALEQSQFNNHLHVPVPEQDTLYNDTRMPVHGRYQGHYNLPNTNLPSTKNALLNANAQNHFDNNVNFKQTPHTYSEIGGNTQNVQGLYIYTHNLQNANPSKDANKFHENIRFGQNRVNNIPYSGNRDIQNNDSVQESYLSNKFLASNQPSGKKPLSNTSVSGFLQNQALAIQRNNSGLVPGLVPLHNLTPTQNKTQRYDGLNVNASHIDSSCQSINNQQNLIVQNQAQGGTPLNFGYTQPIQNLATNNRHIPNAMLGHNTATQGSTTNYNNAGVSPEAGVIENSNSYQTYSCNGERNSSTTNKNWTGVRGGDQQGTHVNINDPLMYDRNATDTVPQSQSYANTLQPNLLSNQELDSNLSDITQLMVTPASLTDDDLFNVFYEYPYKIWQVKAALELYNRCWRYQLQSKRWMRRSPDHTHIEYKPIGQKSEGYYELYEPGWNIILVYDVVDETHFQLLENIKLCEMYLRSFQNYIKLN